VANYITIVGVPQLHSLEILAVVAAVALCVIRILVLILFDRYSVIRIEPLAQIDELAPFGAKRQPSRLTAALAFRIMDRFLANWAFPAHSDNISHFT
jgi:hypothetical protein